MLYNQVNTDYRNDGTVSDGAIIAAPGVRLTNSESGRIFGGVTFTAGGATFVNELGGVVAQPANAAPNDPPLIVGSEGADTIINAGGIGGAIALRGGNDSFVGRDSGNNQIDFGSGDDSYRVEGLHENYLYAEGGEGRDRLVLASVSGQINGSGISGFEDLLVETGGTFQYMNSFQSIAFGAAVRFATLDGRSPSADVSLNGSYLSLTTTTSVRSVRGGAGSDTLSLVAGSGIVVSGDVALGGGDDAVRIGSFNTLPTDTIGGRVDGGAGTDYITISWFSAGSRTFDLARFSGFEALGINSDRVEAASTARIVHAADLGEIEIGANASVVLSDSASPGARVYGGFGGGMLTIEAGSSIGRYGPGVARDTSRDLTQADLRYNTGIVNAGSIVADVLFYTGDDLYDGRAGKIGGVVYGNAGNDVLLGGSGADRLEGGFGTDRLEGNGGDDLLNGGGGADVLIGGTGSDVMTGGAGADVFRGTLADLAGDRITDLQVGDRIHITDGAYESFTFSRNSTTLTLAGTAVIDIGIPNARLAVTADAAGGTSLVAVNRQTAANDFDGDGHSDILWLRSDGYISTWSVGGNVRGNQVEFNTFSDGVQRAWYVNRTFDMNGDGRTDILWRHIDGQLDVWRSQPGPGGVGDDFQPSAFTAATPIGAWIVEAAGDWNGDGRDDLLWYNFTDRSLSIWQSTGDSFQQNAYYHGAVDQFWEIGGMADFDGDGRDDILWRNQSGALSTWLSTGSGFVENAYYDETVPIGTPGTNWRIYALADFSGDGRDDILWRNDNGSVSVWQSTGGGGFTKNSFFASVDPSWRPAEAADFNADGRADILFKNDSNAVSIWQSTGNGFGQNIFYDAGPVSGPHSWLVQGQFDTFI